MSNCLRSWFHKTTLKSFVVIAWLGYDETNHSFVCMVSKMLHIITPRYRPPCSKLDWFRLQSNMVIPWVFTPLIFLVVINTMYYVTCAILEDVFVSLTHMSMNIMFLENVVGNLVNIITIDWPIQVGVFFVQLFNEQ